MNRRDLLTLAAAVGAMGLLPGCASGRPEAGPSTPPASPVLPTPGPATGDPRRAAKAVTHFATELFGRLDGGNVVFSPWSIAMVLSMVREGAVGATASELDRVLGEAAPHLGDDLATATRAILSGHGELNVGNSLWGQQGLAWKQPFLDRLDATYGAPLRQTDFRTAPEPARTQINAWISQQTAGKIPELLAPGLIDNATRLVLANALHFKAPWAQPLIERGSLPFTTSTGTVTVPTLAGGGTWPWFEQNGVRGTTLPCDGGDFALALVLPKDARAAVFQNVLAAPAALVNVQLPAWKFRLKMLLTDALQQLGVRLAFDAKQADFSGMTDAERLYLGFLVHEALIEVNAKGIEAAAATAAGMEAAGALAEPKRLVLDRPFSYALMHVPTATPLFVGRVADPTVESSE